ncbi:MAG: hypothetical protein OEQ39_04485 [Gammaproteobacteria bacterium]|nr:hypothetical protein [Gammaproteobacteria bacterium]
MTDFDLWYYGEGEDKGYPRKEGRGDAKKAFAAALKIATLDELIDGRQRYAAHLEATATERKYIKMPGTWLRAECWADEYEAGQKMSEEHVKYWQDKLDADPRLVPDSIRAQLPQLRIVR